MTTRRIPAERVTSDHSARPVDGPLSIRPFIEYQVAPGSRTAADGAEDGEDRNRPAVSAKADAHDDYPLFVLV